VHPDAGEGGFVLQDLQGAADLPLPQPQVMFPPGRLVEDRAERKPHARVVTANFLELDTDDARKELGPSGCEARKACLDLWREHLETFGAGREIRRGVLHGIRQGRLFGLRHWYPLACAVAANITGQALRDERSTPHRSFG
jgi:hypothetical protein